MDFLFHNLSEKEIKEQVDSIIDSFSKKLSQIKTKIEVEYGIISEKFEREEGGEKCDISKRIMFENAPDKNKDFIIAERKKW